MKKVAIVTRRFIDDPTEGGDIHTKLLATHLKKFAHVTIITTKARNYITWHNELEEDKEIKDGLQILRFATDFSRNFYQFNQLSHRLFQNDRPSLSQEIGWIISKGPYSSALFDYLRDNKETYDLFLFLGYAHPLTFFGLPLVRKRAVLIPLVNRELELQFGIFDALFSYPLMILPNTKAEKQIIKERFSSLPPLFLVGVGIEPVIQNEEKNTAEKINLQRPFILFIGRISKPKGVLELFDYFGQFKKRANENLDLVLIGRQFDLVPKDENIKYLGEVSEEIKWLLISKSEFLVNPSFYESLSLIVLEAWFCQKPVLVNGRCPVLKSQAIESSGGLYYQNYAEFEVMMKWLLKNKVKRQILGKNGQDFLNKNYSWSVIEKKFDILLNALTRLD